MKNEIIKKVTELIKRAGIDAVEVKVLRGGRALLVKTATEYYAERTEALFTGAGFTVQTEQRKGLFDVLATA